MDRQVGSPGLDPLTGTSPPGRHAGTPAPGRAARTSGRWLSLRNAGLAAGLVAIIAAALFAGARLLPHGAGTSGGPGGTPASTRTGGAVSVADVFGVPVRSAGCPAAALRVAVARCPASPECFNGLVVMSGAASAEPLPCHQPHYWETFALAILPADVQTFDQPTVAADPTVRMVCSQAVMLASRQGPARRLPTADWEIQVLPPSEAAYDSGSRVYRCVATEIGHEPSTSQFGR